LHGTAAPNRSFHRPLIRITRVEHPGPATRPPFDLRIITDNLLQNYNERLECFPATYCPGQWHHGYLRVQYPRQAAIDTLQSGQIVSISAYYRPSRQPGTARQIVALGIAFAIVVVSLIVFNLTLERVSLLDDLKKDVRSLAEVHRNYAERELREYDALLSVLADRVRHGDQPGDLIRQRQAYDPALEEGRILDPCVVAPGTGCPFAVARPAGGPAPGLLMDTVQGTLSAGRRLLIAHRLDLTDAEPRNQASGRMIVLTLDLDKMAQG
jgi:hypothetical protein